MSQALSSRSLFVALALVLGSSAWAAPPAIPIAAARQQAQGTTVTVEGLVTVPSGAFLSSSGDEGFALQDQTGGIWISVAKDLRVRLGQRVRVTGALGTNVRKLQIQADPAGVKPLPGKTLRVATGQVGTATLGFLITVEGTITAEGIQNDLPYGYKLNLDDGTGPAQIYLNASTGIDPGSPALQPGRTICVTGFGSQYDVTYEVEPRFRRDVRSGRCSGRTAP